jgi:hypothetical protein
MKEPGSGFARRVTGENLNEFKPLLRQPGEFSGEDGDEDAPTTNLASTLADPELARAEALFQGTPVQLRLPVSWVDESLSLPETLFSNRRSKAARSGTAGGGTQTPPFAGPAAPVARGPLLWQKVLTRTDAQHQAGNITGDLRLTRAEFRVAGKLIKQATYFRRSVFANGTWTDARAEPRVETADFDFEITIRGQHYGAHRLTVSHKPSGEAGQGNYTTGIRWGALSPLLRQVDVSGATLSLYGPPTGTTAPFFIDID